MIYAPLRLHLLGVIQNCFLTNVARIPHLRTSLAIEQEAPPLENL